GGAEEGAVGTGEGVEAALLRRPQAAGAEGGGGAGGRPAGELRRGADDGVAQGVRAAADAPGRAGGVAGPEQGRPPPRAGAEPGADVLADGAPEDQPAEAGVGQEQGRIREAQVVAGPADGEADREGAATGGPGGPLV